MAEPTLLPERLQYRPTKIELDESIEKAKATLLKKIKRSVYVYRVDCGGCNGCEIVHRRRDACHAHAGPARL